LTLILSCLTDRYVIQVSDRRLTKPDGSIYDDNSNKAILLNGNVAFGYTGLAFLNKGSLRTDHWFLNALQKTYQTFPNANLTDIANHVATLATQEISQIEATSELKRLAFIGVGWARTQEQEELKPIYLIISNCHSSDGRWISQAEPVFSVFSFTPPNDLPVMFASDGQPLDAQLRIRVKRLLNHCVTKGLSSKTIARILIATVRQVATSNHVVGKNLLITSIPKISVHPGTFTLTSNFPSEHRQTFTYLPENTAIQVMYGPHVFAFGVSMTELKVDYLKNNDSSPKGTEL
jgi:hypothetical protein